MGDCNIMISVPSELADMIRVGIKNKINIPENIVINPYISSGAKKEDDVLELTTDSSLYDSIKDNFPWLLQQFDNDIIRSESSYASHKQKIKSKIGYMLGIKSDYFSDSCSELMGTVDNSDTIDSSELFDDFNGLKGSKTRENGTKSKEADMNHTEGDNVTDITKSFKAANTGKGLENTGKGLELSEHEQINHSFPSKHEKKGMVNINGHEQLRDMLNNPKSTSKSGDTALCLHLGHKNSKRISISDIESQIFRLASSFALEDEICTVVEMLEQSNILDYVKLVNKVTGNDKRISPVHMRSMVSWKSWIINGNSLCFCGAGSKISLLNVFSRVALRDGFCFKIDANRIGNSDFDQLWSSLKDNLFNKKIKMTKTQMIQDIPKNIENRKRPFYIIIYGMDTFLLNGGFDEIRPLLCLKNVVVIGSMDHLRCGLIMHSLDTYLGNYKLISINTGHDYRDELVSRWDKSPPKFILNQEMRKNTSELSCIMDALSHNHRRLFSLVAQIQIELLETGEKFIGIEKSGILHDPRAITICHNESKLDTLLTEFVTHNVIKQWRGPGGRLYLSIPINTEELQNFTHYL